MDFVSLPIPYFTFLQREISCYFSNPLLLSGKRYLSRALLFAMTPYFSSVLRTESGLSAYNNYYHKGWALNEIFFFSFRIIFQGSLSAVNVISRSTLRMKSKRGHLLNLISFAVGQVRKGNLYYFQRKINCDPFKSRNPFFFRFEFRWKRLIAWILFFSTLWCYCVNFLFF